MNENLKGLLRAVSENNITRAKQYVKVIDAIGMIRGKDDVGEMARITIGLMQALDCVRNDTVIVGATNRLDMIDKTLLTQLSKNSPAS